MVLAIPILNLFQKMDLTNLMAIKLNLYAQAFGTIDVSQWQNVSEHSRICGL